MSYGGTWGLVITMIYDGHLQCVVSCGRHSVLVLTAEYLCRFLGGGRKEGGEGEKVDLEFGRVEEWKQGQGK